MDTTLILNSATKWEYWDFLIRFIINLVSLFLISGMIYLKNYKDNEYFFVMVTFNIVVFFICILLSNVELSLGFAFGIFAIFSILRYRTNVMPIKEMTYQFATISLAIINSIHYNSFSMLFVIFTNSAIILTIFILELIWTKSEKSKFVVFEKIELIKPEFYDKLISDLKLRTGLDITRCEVGDVDFVKDTARIKVYYREMSKKK